MVALYGRVEEPKYGSRLQLMQPQLEIVDDPDEQGSSEHGLAGGNGLRESL